MRRWTVGIIAALWALSPVYAEVAPQPAAVIKAEAPYAFAPMAAGRAGVAYMELRNDSADAWALVGVTSEAFGRIELHTHLHEEGVMKMRRIDQIDLPAGQTTALKPAGLHLMLFEAQLPLAEGTVLPLHLQLKNAQTGAVQTLDVPVPLRERRSKAQDAHAHH